MYKNESLEAKRQAALAYLGERWILHPKYQPIERHRYWGRK